MREKEWGKERDWSVGELHLFMSAERERHTVLQIY